MDALYEVFNVIVDVLKPDILPTCPFSKFIDNIDLSAYIGYMNYFIPINIFLDILSAWVASIASYYAIMIALRWAKIIE